MPTEESWIDREIVCFAAATVLVVGGTLATGLVPQQLPYQAGAGGLIVAGFVVIVLCLRDEPSG